MLRHIRIHHPKPGTRPGALIERKRDVETPALIIHALTFGGPDGARGHVADTLENALAHLEPTATLRWLHFEGEPSTTDLARLGEVFHLHPLALEDVHNHGQRPKFDPYADLVFITLALPVTHATPTRTDLDAALEIQQISLFIGAGFVLSFHAGGQDIFAPIRERLLTMGDTIATARSRAQADHLGYALADVVVDSGFAVVADYDERLERLEDEIFEARTHNLISVIHDLRCALSTLRKTLRAQHETIQRWLVSEHAVVHSENRPYIRDMEDHARRVVDLADSYHDATGALLETHLSLASMRLNEIMRMLTLIATIFMPLSFIAGLYGMNFNTASPWNMPELGWRYGYPIVLGVMGALVTVMLIFFRRKRWL
ncbi:magnesium and cobalt transport protein CorA [Salinisphaera sp. T5B8]|uniref:magnesium/cobalt transporter CorA n=1 Tax=unclassified Salinisphaera TaxID=2649847 RepID=UPI003341ECFB